MMRDGQTTSFRQACFYFKARIAPRALTLTSFIDE
jgi:hypothetical protein